MRHVKRTRELLAHLNIWLLLSCSVVSFSTLTRRRKIPAHNEKYFTAPIRIAYQSECKIVKNHMMNGAQHFSICSFILNVGCIFIRHATFKFPTAMRELIVEQHEA